MQSLITLKNRTITATANLFRRAAEIVVNIFPQSRYNELVNLQGYNIFFVSRKPIEEHPVINAFQWQPNEIKKCKMICKMNLSDFLLITLAETPKCFETGSLRHLAQEETVEKYHAQFDDNLKTAVLHIFLNQDRGSLNTRKLIVIYISSKT